MLENTDDGRVRMQRVRVGLTGLAVVLLLVLLATVIFNRVQSPAGSKSSDVATQDASEDEPLSDLGIVPRAPDNAVTATPPPPPVAPVSPTAAPR